MKLFKGHAVMSRESGVRSRLARTYVVMANTWQEARARIGDREPGAEFVTIPVEIAGALMVDVKLMSEREVADLRSACEWNEHQFHDGLGPLGQGAKR